jgi:hypothetical protein
MPARRTSKALLLLCAAIFLAASSTVAADEAVRLNLKYDKPVCNPGENVRIGVHLSDESLSPVNITLEVDCPDGSVLILLTAGTNQSGEAYFSFRVPQDAEKGIYNLTATCNLNATSLQAKSSLRVVYKTIPSPSEKPEAIPVVPLAGAAAIGLLAVGLAVSATEIGKYGFIALFAPLFTRLNRDETLDNKVRYQLLGYLTENPGQHYNALKKALNITNGGMVYHLLVLEREGFIRSQRDGILKRFYPASVKAPENRGRTPDELVNDIIAAVEKHPGITQKELVERLVVSDEVIGYHLRKIVRDTRIISWKKGKTKVYFPSKKGPT